MATDDEYLRRVERERTKREDELLLLLLALLLTARHEAIALALHGYSATLAIRNVIEGSINHKGAARLIAAAMALAHRDGYRRVGLAAGTRAVERRDAGTINELAALYLPAAQQAARAMADTLTQAVSESLASGSPVRQAIRDAFDSAGYSREVTHGLDLGTERAVVTAHANGVLAAALSGAVPVKGLRHVSILDSGTTDICEQRHGLQLPLSDPYWTSGWAIPSLHFRCRSSLMPLFRDFKPSDWRPTIPPQPGFGSGLVPFMRLVPQAA